MTFWSHLKQDCLLFKNCIVFWGPFLAREGIFLNAVCFVFPNFFLRRKIVAKKCAFLFKNELGESAILFRSREEQFHQRLPLRSAFQPTLLRRKRPGIPQRRHRRLHRRQQGFDAQNVRESGPRRSRGGRGGSEEDASVHCSVAQDFTQLCHWTKVPARCLWRYFLEHGV